MTDEACPEGYQPNPGHVPEDAIGKRVAVIFASGGRNDSGWPADGRNACDWTRSDLPFSIEFYRVLD